jgi:hypothetical protein
MAKFMYKVKQAHNAPLNYPGSFTVGFLRVRQAAPCAAKLGTNELSFSIHFKICALVRAWGPQTYHRRGKCCADNLARGSQSPFRHFVFLLLLLLKKKLAGKGGNKIYIPHVFVYCTYSI